MATWNAVLQFYYGGGRAVTSSNMEAVLAFAHMYQLDSLHRHCLETLKSSCKGDNCLSIWRTSRQYQLEELASKARSVAGKEFTVVSRSPAFLQLSKEDLRDDISCKPR